MDDSILTSIKKYVDVDPDETVFDDEIILCINTAFFLLSQLGVGPETAFTINDDQAVWTDFITDIDDYSLIKTYVALKTKLMFDPPTSGQLMQAIQDQIAEYQWRLNAALDTSEVVSNGS